MTENAPRTGSRKIDAIVKHARDRGLEVEVEVTDETWLVDQVSRNVVVKIRRPRVDPQNMLDVVNNAEQIVLGWMWIRRYGATPKLYHAVKHGYSGTPRKLTARLLPYAIDGMSQPTVQA